MAITAEGIYRDGRVELLETPPGVKDDTRVIITFIDAMVVSLEARGVDKSHAGNLRARLSTFRDDWERPEMQAYDTL
jgi:hypothetical protein